MSSRAPSSVMAVAYVSASPVRSCSGGSRHTLWHTCHDICCEVPQLVIFDGWEATCEAIESMVNQEGMTTNTVAG